MSLRSLLAPSILIGAATLVCLRPAAVNGYTLLGGELDLGQRDFRVFNNFTSPGANGNQTPDPSFPGHTGAVMAIWKGCVEWQSSAHGSGDGDPHQPGGLGSGQANFDPSFQGLADGPGGNNENVHSQISGCNGGVLAYCEVPISDGWRIRYYECWSWDDGPGTNVNGFDLQSVACHEYGHAVGLGHSGVSGATMWPSVGGGAVGNRSIHPDDRDGLQAIYGVAPASKPRVDSATFDGTTVTIQGSGLPASGGQVWFTRGAPGGDGTPIKAPAGPSNGSTLALAVPDNVGPGDVLVLGQPANGSGLSNAAPLDATGIWCGPPERFCEGATNSTGAGATIDWSGSLKVSDALLSLHASGAPSGQFGIFYYGPESTQVPFGEGFRCVGGGALGTFRLPTVVTNFLGEVSYALDWGSAPVGSGPGALVGGSTWSFQFWYRDPAGGGSGFNLSDALAISLCP